MADTTDRLRADIDLGRAGSKVPVSDPAAAPLGADDEAAGTPPTPLRVRLARALELQGPHPREQDHGVALYLATVALWVLSFLAGVWLTD